ncbi:divergent protein kinase domain 1B-like [Branchiostoma floridae]|uniref:Divergent protein kinase domain 1B-like n=1 Tax=Branchiostoma floridae TaxID=7739 RepID=A0A9J7LRR7_BRAFL|nr:divergent protein kinase domain 1B-like [Branchiostoma floridae]
MLVPATMWKLYNTLTALLLAGIASLLSFNAMFNILDHEGRCTTQHLTYMCGLYADGKVQGPLCEAMCSKQLTVHSCLSNRPEKHVLHVSWEQRGPWDTSRDQPDVILKFVSSWYETVNQPQPLPDTNLNHSFLIERQAHYICMENFQSDGSCHSFGLRTVLYADGDSDGKVSQSEFSNMYSLLMQQEFFTLLALNSSESTLDMFGYCGGFYAVQKIEHTCDKIFGRNDHILDVLPPIFTDNINEMLVPMLNKYSEYSAEYLYRNFQQVRIPDWQERVDFITQGFRVLYDFGSQYGTTVRCCDSHLGNYGITDSGRVKYIDMDAVLSTKAASLLLNNTQCETDEDCEIPDYDDCSSKCDTNLGRCRDVMKQNDLHNFCTVTLPHVLLEESVVQDLAVDKKLVKELWQLVVECRRLPLYTTVEDYREKSIQYVWNKFDRIVRDFESVQ